SRPMGLLQRAVGTFGIDVLAQLVFREGEEVDVHSHKNFEFPDFLVRTAVRQSPCAVRRTPPLRTATPATRAPCPTSSAPRGRRARATGAANSGAGPSRTRRRRTPRTRSEIPPPPPGRTRGWPARRPARPCRSTP